MDATYASTAMMKAKAQETSTYVGIGRFKHFAPKFNTASTMATSYYTTSTSHDTTPICQLFDYILQ